MKATKEVITKRISEKFQSGGLITQVHNMLYTISFIRHGDNNGVASGGKNKVLRCVH